MSRPSRAASFLGLSSAVASTVLAVLMLAPGPTYPLWYAHVVVNETSLALTLLGSAAFALTRPATTGARLARVARAASAAAAVVGLLPLAAALPAYAAAGHGFSLLEYVRGVRTPAVRHDRNVVLEPTLPELTADIYHAPGPGPHPFVVVVHGGSWRGGDKGAAVHVSWRLAALGYTVVDVSYSLAPAHPFPAAIREVKCFVGRLREKAGELRIDPSRGALLGRSAGGQIALVAAYSAAAPQLPPACPVEDRPVQGVISLYAPTDLAWGHDHPLRPDVVHGPESLEVYLEGPPDRRPEGYRLGSPLSWVDRPLPRTLLVHGSGDRLVSVEHARRLARGLEAAGQPARLLVIPLAEHGFDMRAGGVGEQLARAVILDFLGPL